MRLRARGRVHGEMRRHPRTRQVAGRIHQLAGLLSWVEGAAEHPHPAPQVRRLHRVVVDVPGHALRTRLGRGGQADRRSEEHTSELQSLMRISYAVFCLKKNNLYYLEISSHTTAKTLRIASPMP